MADTPGEQRYQAFTAQEAEQALQMATGFVDLARRQIAGLDQAG